MATTRTTKCPVKLPDGSRKHGNNAPAVWLQVISGSGPKTMRPWCKPCLDSGGDSVLIADSIYKFFRWHPSVAFAVILSSVETYQDQEHARQQVPLDQLEPHDVGREAELDVLRGCYRGATVERLLGRR